VFFFVFISKFPQHPNEHEQRRGEKTGTEAADENQRPHLFAREEEEETASGRGGRAAKGTTSEREDHH
jgi:hypothetical protein